MRPSIRQQTLLLALLPMLVAVILTDGYFLYSRFNSMEADMIERTKLLARQIGASVEFALFSGNTEQLQREAALAIKQKDIAAIVIQNVAGKTVSFAGKALTQEDQHVVDTRPDNGMLDFSNYFWISYPIFAQEIALNETDEFSHVTTPNKLGYVWIKTSKLGLQQEKWNVLLGSSVISVLLLLITAVIVFRVSRRIIHPIKSLNVVARNIGDGQLNFRMSTTPDILELSELTVSINEMAQQLQQDRITLNDQTEKLRSNEDRLNGIITTMPVALFIKDAKSRITLMNSACEAQWGVLFSNLVGTDGSRYFPPEQMSAFLASDQAVFAGRKMVNFEESVWNSETKSNRILHTFKKPIYSEKGEPLYLIGISVDISERKHAEVALKQLNEQLETRIEEATRALRLKKEDAENANYDKTRFLASASHDLRQPMHAMGLFVGELIPKLTTPEQLRIAAKVEESVEALSNLLDALLDISKLDAGVVIPNITTFTLGNLLERISHNYVPIAERKDIALHIIPNTSLLQSDPILIERILINLISNAIRYTPVGGVVVVVCRNRGDKLRIEVRDNGVGIPVNEQRNIFREFVQLTNQERDRSKGLGLGLAIVDRIVKLLNLHFDLRSAPNRGSTFSVEVPKFFEPVTAPLITPAFMKEESKPVPANELENLDVLVIDDDALVRKSTQGIIESWGCRVSMAAALHEVKELHCKADYDLVICDFRLPDGNGIEMADWIKENFRKSPIFILISGDTSPEVLQMVNERGIQLLHKPVRPAKLRSLIQFMLNQQAIR